MKRTFLAAALALLVAGNSFGAEPETVLLWPQGAPEALGTADADKPTVTVYLPEKRASTRAAVVVCPGGGYGGLAIGHEGTEIAQWLNERGLVACILRYRLTPYKHPVMMNDVNRAFRVVRSMADKIGIDPSKIGVWGFSAGGHLASTAGTHFDAGDAQAKDPVDQVSCRPDFMILCYPVITMDDSFTHKGSKANLLGKDPSPELVELMSNEKQVTPQTPPTFLFHTVEDVVVPVENCIQFFLALRQAKVDSEMHVYQKGRHGVGLAQSDPILSEWPKLLEKWFYSQGILTKN